MVYVYPFSLDLFGSIFLVSLPDSTGADSNSIADFNPVWIAEFKRTNAYEVWQRVTDPMLFDIVEPRYATFSSSPYVPAVC